MRTFLISLVMNSLQTSSHLFMAWLSGPGTVPIGTSANPVTWCKLKPVGPLRLHIVVVIVEPHFVNGVMSSTVISYKWWRRCWFCLWQQLLRKGREKPLQEQEEITKAMFSEASVKESWLPLTICSLKETKICRLFVFSDSCVCAFYHISFIKNIMSLFPLRFLF